LNRAVAVAEVHGPTAALELLDALDLGAYHLFHATRAELLRRLDRADEAASAYRAALARTAPDGSLVLLADQDRSRWDRARIAEGSALVEKALRMRRLGPYQLQAAIAAVHADAARSQDTDWVEFVGLYDELLHVTSSAVGALTGAVAVPNVSGPATALVLVDALDLDRYHPWHGTRADLLSRLDRHDDAATAYDRAAALTDNPAERAFYDSRSRSSRERTSSSR
jgi:RNA polymerase sigma-70 factor (ECF subfamily)